jgi:hypothetical protein
MNDAFSNLFRDRGPRTFWVGFTLAVAAFVAAQMALAAINGFWIDEYFSAWISDPTMQFDGTFLGRVVQDTNPPLYFTLLRLVRGVTADPRAAFLVLDAICLLACLAVVFWTARRAGMARLGLAAAAALLLSGPVLQYFPEGRTYFAAICLTFLASWLTGLTLTVGGAARLWMSLAIVGAVASLTHVFAALFCGSLAGGLVVEGLLSRRRNVWMSGVALGSAASLVFVTWFLSAPLTLNSVSWIVFTYQAVMDALWYVRNLIVGPVVMLLPLLALALFGLRAPGTRQLLVVFGITGVLFVLLPIAISFKTPIISGRYWTIGGPVVPVFLVFLARAFVLKGDQPSRIAAAGVAAYLLAIGGLGFMAARQNTLEKPLWKGGEIVAGLAANCGPKSIHVLSMSLQPFAMTTFTAGFPLASKLPPEIFVDTAATDTPLLQVSNSTCPVVGWAEHIQGIQTFDQTDELLVRSLKIEATPDQVRVVRQRTGFLVLNTVFAPAPAAP